MSEFVKSLIWFTSLEDKWKTYNGGQSKWMSLLNGQNDSYTH